MGRWELLGTAAMLIVAGTELLMGRAIGGHELVRRHPVITAIAADELLIHVCKPQPSSVESMK